MGAIVLKAPILEFAALYVNDKPLGTVSQLWQKLLPSSLD
jgi:hypothetical protein